MSLDEYAEFQRANGTDVVNVDGVWWKRVRPFFYQPLFPFQEIIPDSVTYPSGYGVGGFQHIVPQDSNANSLIHFLVWDDIKSYSLDSVTHSRRSKIKRGMKHFTIKQLTDVSEFISAGHEVYCSFFSRTKYQYKKNRSDKKNFSEWASTLFNFPKVRIMGAYSGKELAAVRINYLVEDVLIDATFMTKTEYMKLQISDLMVHNMRERAAEYGNIRFIYEGTVKGEKGLDDSKLMRGCKVLSWPAFYRINPLADYMIKKFMTKEYKKLTGLMDCYSEHKKEESLC